MRKDVIRIINVFLTVAILFYGYYILFHPQGLEHVYRNWDGPGYAVVAKTLYDVKMIEQINPFPFLAPSHYAYQFPLYPLFIRLFSFIGYSESMIFVSQLFTLGYSIALYFLVKAVNPRANALFVSIASIFVTPRWFIVSHVGSTEPAFLFFITLFALYFYKKNYLASAAFAALAQLAKPQGIIFFAGLAIYFLYRFITDAPRFREYLRTFLPYLLIPAALMATFTVYYFRFGDFFVFMKNEAFPTMQWPPLKILTSPTVYNAVIDLFVVWKEAIVYTYFLYALGIALLFEKKLHMVAVVSLTYFLPVLLFCPDRYGPLHPAYSPVCDARIIRFFLKKGSVFYDSFY